MKKILSLLLIIFAYTLNAQATHYNTTKGFALQGYDPVSYFQKSPKKGNNKYIVAYGGVKYKFSCKNNLDTFNDNPGSYMPQYGGYCAYAIAEKSEKVSIDPKTYEIRDGKLYLFYNSWGMNTLKSWRKKSPDELKVKADANWSIMMQ